MRWLRRVGLALVAGIALLLAPVGYTELMCRGTAPEGQGYTSLLPPEAHRPESRTLMTYPEWHIVHAYDDYARVIRDGDPHDFAFLDAIGGFWSSLCRLTRASAAHGGVDGGTRQMVYTIGVSFTAELLAKAAYEETLGRLSAALRGPDHAATDVVSAGRAAQYATFLQQVPWYRWDFAEDRAALRAAPGQTLRDRERRVALGLEAGTKAAYARVIERAVAGVGADALRLQMIVGGLAPQDLTAWPDVRLIGETAQGLRIETPRYRALTGILRDMARTGATFAEIAGNDDILLTVLSDTTVPGALASFDRQGYGDVRSLLLIRVADLAGILRDDAFRVEHVPDY